MRFRPAALSLRFLGAAFGVFAGVPFIAAQRFRCASAIRARTSGLRLRLFAPVAVDGGVALGDAADLGGRPRRPVPSPSIDRTCCICCSKVFFCASNPSSAAFSTSELKTPVCVGMYSDYDSGRYPAWSTITSGAPRSSAARKSAGHGIFSLAFWGHTDAYALPPHDHLLLAPGPELDADRE